jgi:hypothetical protein
MRTIAKLILKVLISPIYLIDNLINVIFERNEKRNDLE